MCVFVYYFMFHLCLHFCTFLRDAISFVSLLLMCLRAKGSAYVFYSADGVSGWSEVSKLVASDGAAYNFFGWSVSVWSNVIVVGAGMT